MKKQAVKFILSVLFLCLFNCGCGNTDHVLQFGNSQGFEDVFLEDKGETVVDEKLADLEADRNLQWLVHVCGEVQNPGVYYVDPGSRIYDAIMLAGGFSAHADEEYLNLAKLVEDGQKISVPSLEESMALAQEQNNLGYININQADVSQLCTLAGIGESRAKDIVAFRENNGGFAKVEDIMLVPGIKESVYQKIKDSITVD